jgi:hypothetical protein
MKFQTPARLIAPIAGGWIFSRRVAKPRFSHSSMSDLNVSIQ